MFGFASALAWSVALAATLPDDDVAVLPVADGSVVVVEDRRVPLVWLRLAWPIGAHDPWGASHDLPLLWPPLAQFALQGAQAGRFEPWVADDAVGIDVLYLRSDEAQVLRILNDFFVEDFERIAFRPGPLRASYRRRARAAEARLHKALAEAFFVDGDPRLAAYAPPVSPRLSGRDLQSYRKTVARQDGWVVGVAGDTSPIHARELADAVRDHLGGGPAVPVQALPELRPTATRPARVVVYDKGLTEGTFVWATEGLALSDPRAAAGLVAAEALRLAVVDEVRHRRGDTYAISAEGLLQPAPGVFVLTTHTEPSRAPDHIEAVESVLQSVATGGLSEQHIARARDRISGMAQTASSSPVGRLTIAVQRQLARDDASMSAVLEQVPQVSDAEVMSFAEAWGSGRWTQASLLPATAR